MEQLVVSGRIAIIALALMGIEIIVLGIYYQRSGKGLSWHNLFSATAPGAALLSALLAALCNAGWHLILACLAAALPLHIYDMLRRATR